MEKKIHSKSVRLSDKVFHYIEAAPGNGFNNKFENIIIEAVETVPQRERELAYYDDLIKKRKVQFDEISTKINRFDFSIQSIFRLQEKVHDIQRQIEQIINDS